jgi:hypothetical protein
MSVLDEQTIYPPGSQDRGLLPSDPLARNCDVLALFVSVFHQLFKPMKRPNLDYHVTCNLSGHISIVCR